MFWLLGKMVINFTFENNFEHMTIPSFFWECSQWHESRYTRTKFKQYISLVIWLRFMCIVRQNLFGRSKKKHILYQKQTISLWKNVQPHLLFAVSGFVFDFFLLLLNCDQIWKIFHFQCPGFIYFISIRMNKTIIEINVGKTFSGRKKNRI